MKKCKAATYPWFAETYTANLYSGNCVESFPRPNQVVLCLNLTIHTVFLIVFIVVWGEGLRSLPPGTELATIKKNSIKLNSPYKFQDGA